MDLDTIKTLINVGQFLITGGIGIWLYLDKKNDKTHVRISKLESELDDRLDQHSSRLASLEAQVDNTPSHSDLSRLGRCGGYQGAAGVDEGPARPDLSLHA